MPALTLALLLLFAAPASSTEKPKGIVGESEACSVVRVIDGDTVDVKIGERTDRLRLLDIDTEESHNSVAKKITPFGLETSAWAKEYVQPGIPCFVEYGPERRDVYDRVLAYLWVKREGAWENYNLTTVKTGRAPYFTKYGYSKNHHEEFAAAQKDAEEKHVGIWDPANEGNLRGAYLGTAGLIAWWNDRADSIARFEKEGRMRPDILDTRWHFDLLRAKSGGPVTVFTSIREPDAKAAGFVGKCEGKISQVLQIVAAGGDAKVEDALKASIGRYRYFRGQLERGDDGKSLRLTIASTDDIAVDPPPKPAAAPKSPAKGRGKK
ncbi:MAG TPA: thermonuclease family protein [bacterium]|nr:thermonuclease family protein [bacterium]